MEVNTLVFRGEDVSLDNVVEHAIKNAPQLKAGEVQVICAARAPEGEVWSPQLPAYDAWVPEAGAAVRVKSQEKGGSDAARGGAAAEGDEARGTDGNLLVVGSLGMGISDDAREKLLSQARFEQRGGFGQASSTSREDGVDLSDAVGVRQDPDGYALTMFDLRRFATALGSSDGLIAILPAFVDGVPVVRIAAEAFARRLVQGVGLKLLIVPDTVSSIASGAFSALSAQRIHLGASVRVLGEQPCDVAGVSPRLSKREYTVQPGNVCYEAHGGSLFDDCGARLLFLASPYAERVALPAGIERVSDAAFAQGCAPPSVVSCPSSLVRVDARTWDDAVWLCPHDAAVRGPLASRGVRLAGAQAVERDGCWYDFDEQGAVLVAGPPAPASVSRRFAQEAAARAAAKRGLEAEEPGAASRQDAVASADALVLPREVEGRPLVRLGVRALPYAPATLVVPDTVHAIERDNFCRGTKRLVLPCDLERIGSHCFCSRILEPPVSIPASVRSIGEGSFEYAVCRLERTGSIVHVSADQLLSCFCDKPADGNVPFDFACYDELLCSGKNVPDKMGAVLHRLTVPYRLDGAARAVLVAYLRDHEQEAMQRIAHEGGRAMVAALLEAGFIDERTFNRQIELLRACNRTDCVIYLMDQHRAGPKPATMEDRFAL